MQGVTSTPLDPLEKSKLDESGPADADRMRSLAKHLVRIDHSLVIGITFYRNDRIGS
jgi:hypothetical protein